MKKIIPVLLAIVLIIIVAGVSFGSKILDRYSYSKEREDLSEYFHMSGADDVAIVLQDEIIENRAKMIDGTCYLDLDTVHALFNERFYADKNENILLYTLPMSIVKAEIGGSTRETESGTENLGYVPARFDNGTLYIAVDYVQEYTNFEYMVFTEPDRIQIYTEWNERQIGFIRKDTQVRIRGGIKSNILEDAAKGDKVIVLEQMDEWSKVKTADSVIGYVENKRLEGIRSELPIPPANYTEPEYSSATRDYKINMGWHVVAGTAGNDTLSAVTANTKGLNVISPTWFKLNDNDGSFESYAASDYVTKAHDMGLEVWALIENIEYADSIDMYAILSSTSVRANLINNLVETVLAYDIDGINLDFEQISMDCGEHYIEFIRELSIPCRKNGIVLSVDNYVPTGYTAHYNRKEQGVVADYVVIMGYDEHYAGSAEAGSVASIDFVEEGIKQTIGQVPAKKIINAIPFYTRIWDTSADSISSQAVGMDMAEEYIAAHGITKEWDDATCQNYGEYESDGVLHQVWLEDEDSIKVKLNIMDKYEIAGVAEWRLGFEKPAIWDVIEEYMDR